ncbi:hypothetical protein EEB19_20085 [Gordonia sp. OPL2]|nr:hypothetical protein EEB19_20085 [Gordonia sp. OPL2]
MRGHWPEPEEAAAARKSAARRAGERLLDDARDRAPELTGELKDSGEMTELDDDAARVSFTAPHAMRQHYLDYEHPRGGERFFLLNASEEIGPQLGQILADELRTKLGG